LSSPDANQFADVALFSPSATPHTLSVGALSRSRTTRQDAVAAFKQQRIELGFVSKFAIFDATVPGRAFAVVIVNRAAHCGADAGFIGV